MSFKIGWFSTGKDEQALTLLQKSWEATKKGKIGTINICYVFINKEKKEENESDAFIKLVKKMEIPLISFSSKKFKPELRKRALKDIRKNSNFQLINQWRILYDREVMKRIQKYRVKTIFLAGYMLILGEELCEKFLILNLHPALPGGPKGTWQEIIWQLINKRIKETGVMIHRVTPQLDAGPAAVYCKFPLVGEIFNPLWKKMEEKLREKTLSRIQQEEQNSEPLFSTIRKEQIKKEVPFVLITLDLLSQNKINIQNLKEPIFVKI